VSSSVRIRGSRHGISVKLDSGASYEEIKNDIAAEFKQAEKFLGEENLAVSFEGKPLTEQQQDELVDIIHQNCNVHIVCVLDQNTEQEKKFQHSVQKTMMEVDASIGQFYKGPVRSGQVLEFEQSVILIGDVNAGASIVSKGNIIILGTLRGTAYAGAAGRKNSFIVAMNMQPIQLRIAEVSAMSSGDDKELTGPRIAYAEGENIYIEPLTKSVLNDITL